MALPTSGLTLHCDAKDTDHIFTTYVGTGVHTGTPSDGSSVQVWDDEGDGISDVCLTYETGAIEAPTYRSSTPLMKNPCLDFDGSNDYLMTWVQDGNPLRPASDFLTDAAFTIIVAFWPESITNTAASPDSNEVVIGDSGGYLGLSLKDVSGVKTLRGFNWDGAAFDTIERVVSTGATWIAVFRHASGNLELTTIDDAGTESSAASVASGNTTLVTLALRVGFGNTTVSARYNGRIGELAIWNTALTGTPLSDAKQYFKDNWLTLGGGGTVPRVLHHLRQQGIA